MAAKIIYTEIEINCMSVIKYYSDGQTKEAQNHALKQEEFINNWSYQWSLFPL